MTPIVLRRSVTFRYRALCAFGAAILAVTSYAVAFVPLTVDVVQGVRLMSVFLAAIFLWSAVFYSAQLWTVDAEAVTVRKSNVFGSRTRSWPMRDIVSVTVRKGDGEEPRDTWYVKLRCASGKRLTLPACKGRIRADEIAEEIETWRRVGVIG